MKTIEKLLAPALVLATLALTACSNLIDTEEKATTNTSAYLKITCGSAARTVTPDYELDKMTDFVLTGAKAKNDDIKQLATFESYAELRQATIPIAPGVWYNLTLTAYEEQTAFTATVNSVTIQSGANTITFPLAIDEAATAGTGAICVTFTIPSATAVKCVKAGLFDRSTDNEIRGYELETLAFNTTEEGASAVYEADIAPGTYRLKAWFYADEACTAIVSTYNELVTVVAGNTSQAERGIQLNDTVTIMLDSDGSAADYIYTRYSTLPTVDEMEKDGYFFDGWYTTDDYTGEQITDISPTQAKDVTVYAKWIRGCAVYASELSDIDLAKDSYGDTYTVRLLGEWTNQTISSLGSKIKSISERHITLDMTPITGVTEIGGGAFSNCTSLESITIPDSVTTISGTFYNCTSLKTITYCGTLAQWCALEKPYNFFQDTRHVILTGENNLDLKTARTLAIPYGVTRIGSGAFYGCTSLESITIPDSVTSIGGSAFSGCTSLENITIPDDVTSIESGAFSGCESLISITIPDSVTIIGSSAFYGCTWLESITIGDSVTTIGDYAFEGCKSLTSITIPDSVTSIKKRTFWNCTSLESIRIGNSVTSIDSYAFCNCESLISVTIPDNVTSIEDYAFLGCSALTNITIPDSVTSIGGSALTSVTSISDGAFLSCSSLESVTIPDSITHIGNYAFSCCTSLESVTIGNGVTSISDGAFSACRSLTSIMIPDNVTSIRDSAFYGCGSLKSITIPNGVTRISNSAFYVCTSLKSITIPDSVTSIKDSAFWNCTALTEIMFAGTMAQWESITKGSDWNYNVPATKVVCTDGEVAL